jgi:Nitroreductase family
VHAWRGHTFANDHLDAFFNATVDAAIALETFVAAAEAAGLGCCPISVIRNHAEEVSGLLGLPDHVFPVAGLGVGIPALTQRQLTKSLLPATPRRLCRTRQDVITVAAAWLDGNKSRGERVCSFDGIAFRAGDFVSITLDDFDVDPQTRPVLRVALERTRVSLGLTDDLADGIIAKQIIELAKAGERNPDLLCEGALERLRGGLWGD